MSTSSNSRAHLPSQAVDRLFARFTAIYGAQKMASAWGNVDVDERNAVWAEALGRYELLTIGEAVRELAEDGTGWPPTLPEFVAIVRAKAEPTPAMHRPALPVPKRTPEEVAAGAEQMARIRALLRGAIKPMVSE
jgi:hypothetical protein